MKDKIGHDLKNIAQKIVGISHIIKHSLNEIEKDYTRNKLEGAYFVLKSVIADLDKIWEDISEK